MKLFDFLVRELRKIGFHESRYVVSPEKTFWTAEASSKEVIEKLTEAGFKNVATGVGMVNMIG
ncbi:hypothetical protein ACFLZM_01545, partial [Thermodesulfobacteriota bacterium]